MKKLFLILFSFLFLGTALTGSVFLLAGCDYSQSQEENNDENFENGQNNENESESNEPDEDDNKPDDTEELAAWYYYAIRFCGTIVVSDKNTSNWSISNIYNSFDDIGGEVSVTGGSSCQTPRVSSTDSSMSTYGGIYIYFYTDIVNTSIKMEVDSMPPGYTFVGWYRGYDNGEEILYEPLSTSSTSSTYYITVSGFFARGGTTNAAADACDDMANCIFAAFSKANVLTINYAAQQATNSTTITLSAPNGGTLSTTSLSNGGRATLTAVPDYSLKTVVISLSNDSSYDYYMRIGSAPTTSSYTMIYDSTNDSYTYEWNTNTPNPNVTINIYIKQRYTITYSSNTGSGSMSATYKIHGEAVNLRSNTFKKTGYHFSGWSLSATGSVSYSNGASYTKNASDVLYAVWQVNTYYVKFNGNGSTSGSMSNQTFTYGVAQALTANAFSRNGYTFAGWATSASGSVVYSNKQSVSNLTTTNGGTVNLYAKWSIVSYTITYNGNGGSTPSKLTYNIESTSTLSSSSRTGYTFNGWKPSTTSGNWISGTTYASGTSVKGKYGTVTLVAQWTAKQYTLTLKGNGGTPDTQTMSPKLVFDTGNWNDVAGNRPTRAGYTFKGFYTSATGGVQVYDANGQCVEGDYWQNKQYKHDGNLTVYAQWNINTYTLTIKYYSFAGVSGNPTDLKITAPSGNTISSSQIAVNGTATIKHTYSTSAQTITIERVNTGASYYIDIGKTPTTSSSVNTKTYDWAPTGNSTINLYIYRRYSITFNGNGNTSGTVPSTQYKIHGTAITLPTNNLTRTGYTANGWNTNSAGSGTHYNNGATYSGNGNVTIYAQWTAKQYTLTLKGNGGTPDTQVMSPKLIFDTTNWNAVTAQRPTRAGFTFTGFYTSATGGEQVYDANGMCVDGTYWKGNLYKYDGDLTVYAHWEANLAAKKDEAGGYWYVEMGMYPQKRASTTEIASIGSSNGNSYVINGKSYTAKKGANNTEFVQYNGVWYKVEPIKWRLTGNSSQKVGYGTTTDTLAIMDTIVYTGQFATSSLGIGQGYDNRATTSFENLVKNADNSTYLVSYSPSVESFGVSGVTTKTATDKIFISSEEEIQQVAGSYEVKFSDLVKDILGITIYFTRDMGTNINNITCRIEYGGLTQKFATSVQGFQFTIKVSEYGCVS